MKTLKKSLCLIMALVFVLGLCTFGAGAAFTDAADIEYKDAVAVMNGLEIILGRDDGTFDPKAEVTRAEAATMITKMILGKEAAAKLPKASVFDDVADSHWASKYINYCAGKKIIVGRGNGIFDPEANVTGLELAKMLLVACGYGEMGEFAPDTWEIYTFTYAVENGIYDDVDTDDFAVAATREECALYVFNTLFVGQVKYDVDMNAYDEKTYKEDGEEYPVTYGYKTFKLAGYEGMVIENQATGADYTVVAPLVYDEDNAIPYQGVAEDYAKNFAFESGAELIGHKVHIYYNTNKKTDADKVVYYNTYLESDLSKVYAISSFIAPKGLGTLAAEMGYPTGDFRKAPVFEDGEPAGEMENKVANFNGVYNLKKDTNVVNLTASGLTPVAKANGSKDTDSAYFSKVGSLVVDEKGEIISAIKTNSTYGQVTAIEDGVVTFVDSDGMEYEATKFYEGIAEDDYVVVVPYGGGYTLRATSTKTITISKIAYGMFGPSSFDGVMVGLQDGIVKSDAEGDPVKFSDITTDQTIKFFIGDFGVAFDAVKVKDAVYNYVYLTGSVKSEESDSWGDVTTYKAQAVDGEGKEISLVIGYAAEDLPDTIGQTTVEAGLYKAVDDYDAALGKSFVKLKNAEEAPEIKKVEGRKYEGTESHIAARAYLTSATKYLYVSKSGDTLKVSDGISLRGKDITAYYVADTTKPSNVSTVWITACEGLGVKDSYIFACEPSTGGYITASSVARKDAVDYYVYDAYIDGVKTSDIYLKNPSVQVELFGSLWLGGFYSYEVDANGLYKLTEELGMNAKIVDGAIYNGKLLADFGYDDWDEYHLFNNRHEVGTLDDIVLDDYVIVDLTSGYQDAKGFNHKMDDADSMAAAMELGYALTIEFVYDADAKAPVDAIYITACVPAAN